MQWKSIDVWVLGLLTVYFLFKGVHEYFVFQEVIYQRALAIEFTYQGLSFEREKEMIIIYRDEIIGTRRADFFVEELVMVEIKAVEQLLPVHKTQAINYLEIYNIADGLLMNFGGMSLEFKRVYNKNLITP